VTKPGRFPPPSAIDEHIDSFLVRGANGQGLAYVHLEDEAGRRPKAEKPTGANNVRFQGVKQTRRGQHATSPFDPTATSSLKPDPELVVA
jgi:hypothetical protein